VGVQQIADRLAARLSRPVLVEDPLQRVVAYSDQDGPLDALLRRRTAPEVRDWLRSLGVFSARSPMRTPAAPELGFQPRVCVPARCRDHLLGFLWLSDIDGSMTDAQIAVALDAATQIALALFHEGLVARLSAQREREAVACLLAGDPSSAQLLMDADCFPRGTSVTVHVVTSSSAGVLEQGLLLLRRRLGGRAPLHLVRADHGVLLAADPGITSADLLSAFDAAVTVGTGRPRPDLSQAGDSYTEALEAASIAARIPDRGPVASWSDLGVYRWLARLPAGPSDAHPGLGPLLAADPDLVLTLETYLDNAGSAGAVAARLGLHRSTLYHRLHRIETLTGANLSNGEDRLALHLGLKLARLHPHPGFGRR
jgi:PucR-like helix-turn-helix protein/diguanylate cyclase with GGDEF domain